MLSVGNNIVIFDFVFIMHNGLILHALTSTVIVIILIFQVKQRVHRGRRLLPGDGRDPPREHGGVRLRGPAAAAAGEARATDTADRLPVKGPAKLPSPQEAHQEAVI